MAEPLHTPVPSEPKEFTDKRGRKRKVHRIVYRRSDKAKENAERTRLGSLADTPETHDQTIQNILSELHLIITTPHHTAKIITKTRLKKDTTTHKITTGAEIIDQYLDRSGSPKETLAGAFSQYKQLYVFFGYIEARNRMLPELIVQLMGQRFHSAQHVWLLTPKPLHELIQQWGPTLEALNYYPQKIIPTLNDQTTQEKGPESYTRQEETRREETNYQDPKFHPQKKKYR